MCLNEILKIDKLEFGIPKITNPYYAGRMTH